MMITIKLTDSEMSCIYSLVKTEKDAGIYAGNKGYYYKRIQSILDKLEKARSQEKNKIASKNKS